MIAHPLQRSDYEILSLSYLRRFMAANVIYGSLLARLTY